jgi:hypothetical protein
LPQNSVVKLSGSQTDLYGRTVAEVINNKAINTNKKMTELGLVVWYKFQKGCDEYRELEKKAKKSKIGIWSDPNFEMPWEYRTRMGIGFRGQNNTTNESRKTTTVSTSYQRTSSFLAKKNTITSKQNLN